MSRNIEATRTFHEASEQLGITGSTLPASRDTVSDHDSGAILSQDKSLQLPLLARFVVAGAIWELSTNSQEILAIMHDVFQSNENDFPPPDLQLGFFVDFALTEPAMQIRPHFRALEHLYYGTYGPGDSMLVDQLHRRVVGAFSLATVRDAGYWKRVILPCLVGISSSCVGVTPVHCACVVKNQRGLLIHGDSGAGKSTLALTLSLNGFSYVSDDCTYISSSDSGLQCWGSSAPLKLLPEGVAFFPSLSKVSPRRSLNDELAFEVDPTHVFGVKRSLSCHPQWLLFIERTRELKADFIPIHREEAASRLASDLELLPDSIASQRLLQLAVIDSLVQRGCWIVRHGLQPEALALLIEQFCFNTESDDHRSSQTL